MIACVFVGPTLAAADVRERLEALVLPPARQGDVYRAVSRLEVDALGLVDGYFAAVPSVWHKEILFALEQGVRVYGGGSMGALRAAELADFGMRGCGRIFEAYASGVFEPFAGEPFEDDDEVAVVHAPPLARYEPLSEAMVNVRASLAKAAAEGVLGWEAALAVATAAKSLFYADRTWERVLDAARASVPATALAALADWLPGGRVDQKREDALELLATMRADAGSPAPAPGFDFAHTRAWERLASAR